MSLPLQQSIPYHPDSALLFEAIASRPWSVFLDSAQPGSQQGRYDILASDPTTTLVCRGATTEITSREGSTLSHDDPFQLLREQLAVSAEYESSLPFTGGAIGYFGYDLAWRLERLPRNSRCTVGMPDMAVGIYDWAVVVDHEQKQSWLIGQGRDETTRQRWQELVAMFSTPSAATEGQALRLQGAIWSNLPKTEYAAAFKRIQDYIHEGDCYQVNLAQRFEGASAGDPWSGYRLMRQINPSPYSAYINLPDGQILSSSPERFLQVRKDEVETRPIKGTRPRSEDVEEDRRLADELRNSEKDRAENLMIVDLLRNDLGKSCIPGSVKTTEMFSVESFPTVHHLVSTVRGRLAEEYDAIDLLRGCFPGGSITGAPKVRAMQIIEELEPNRRGVYCGSIGYLGFDGAMDSSIVIRTLIHRSGKIYYSSGGGIVADSDLEQEYQETFDKAAAMMTALEYPARKVE
jgi:para-aminobenzoate synthetase component 1